MTNIILCPIKIKSIPPGPVHTLDGFNAKYNDLRVLQHRKMLKGFPIALFAYMYKAQVLYEY